MVVGYRIKRADPPIRLAYARAYRACLRLFFGLRVHDVDCACKLFRREALEGIRLESRGAFLSAELLIKLQARGRRVAEVGVPHYPRTAGSASGADPRVVLRAVRDFWLLRVRLWAGRDAAMRRGMPVLGHGRDGCRRDANHPRLTGATRGDEAGRRTAAALSRSGDAPRPAARRGLRPSRGPRSAS